MNPLKAKRRARKRRAAKMFLNTTPTKTIGTILGEGWRIRDHFFPPKNIAGAVEREGMRRWISAIRTNTDRLLREQPT